MTQYELRITWRRAPGWDKEPIAASGPAETISAILRQVCATDYALTNLQEITVKEAKP